VTAPLATSRRELAAPWVDAEYSLNSPRPASGHMTLREKPRRRNVVRL
jgi:hypothetical protein